MSSSEEEAEFDGGDVRLVAHSSMHASSGPVADETNADGGSTSSTSSNGDKAKGKKSKSKKGKPAKKKAAAANKTKKTAKPKKPSEKTNKKSGGGGATKKAAAKKASKAKSKKAPSPEPASGLDMFIKHYREFERGLTRLEKVDQFAFFWDDAPPEFEENYDNNSDSDDASSSSSDTKKPKYPSHPPINWEMIRRRRDAGRYILDHQERDESRLQEIGSYLEQDRGEQPADRPTEIRALHRKGVNWELFRKDVFGMCDSALERNPDDAGDGKAGSLLHAVKKIKGVLDTIYDRTGYRHNHDMLMANDRHQFNTALEAAENKEAAFQGKWRQIPFPERKYEPCVKNVVCAGLSELDERIASYELRTSLPDSFVGVSYTFKDDTKSEAWMKSVLSSEAGGHSQEAARAMAQDEGVIRAQVSTLMEMMLVAVQDRVMTEADVLHQPELRSANWEIDGEKIQRKQPTDQSSNTDDMGSSEAQGSQPDSTPEIVEQPVWGIDCYTRRNVTTCLATEFDHETSLVFIEKWLLPAINACPVDLAHDIANAALILEGLPFAARSNLYYEGAQDNDESIVATEQRWSHSLIGKSLKHKIATTGPPWLKLAARLLRRSRESMGADFFRIHPKGHGSIVLSPTIPPNTLVTQYRGEVYPSWRWGEKMDAIDITQERKQLKPALPDFYNMALERPQKDPRKYGMLFVDASRKAGHGSSVSHSCAPSCEVRVAAVGGQLCLAMTTLRSIEMGEELTFDYNAVTESLVEYRQAVCLCGYSKCRGSFLHFATADCYQEVLKRNAPIAVRFANLAKGCMKEVMSEEDENTLRNHGFMTAAFGAVSVNRHKVNGLRNDDFLDSMDNVPVWLRTYVANTLQYIEYERRALPISLICEDISKNNGGKAQGKGKEESATEEESKPVKGSKPMPTFFFYSKSNEARFKTILKEEEGLNAKDLPGLEMTRAIKRVASARWKLLSIEEKAKWKKKAEKAWEKQGGLQKAELEKQRKLGGSSNDSKQSKKSKKEESLGDQLEASSLSFRDADAEGYSAMEQRIQQLTQSLSRVGRVLDRHREGLHLSGDNETEPSSEILRSQVHAPLTIATDDQIVAWMWNDSDGVVRTLLAKAEGEGCVSPALKAEFNDIMKRYEVLDSFGDHSSLAEDPKSYLIRPRKARRKLRIALLELRRAIMKDLKAMAKDLKKEKNREKAERKKQLEDERQAKKAKEEDADRTLETEEVPSGESDNDQEAPKIAQVGSDFESSSVVTPSLLCEEIKNDRDSVPMVEEDVHSEVGTTLRQLVDAVVFRAQEEAKELRLKEDRKPKPWLKHYSQRFKLQAAADLLLMYARTSTFFLLQPYKPLESTPIEVYARELGNAVPRSVIDRSVANKKNGKDVKIGWVDEEAELQPAEPVVEEKQSKGKGSRRKAVTSNVASTSLADLCAQDDVVAEVTVKYQGDYVLSQLLQWYNGGIGQSPGLPNETLGCIRLPSMSGLWERVVTESAKARIDKPTVYETKTRKSLITWFSDPHQRGSPWPDNITAAFSPDGSEDLPKDTSTKWIPLGSPILDILVTGDDTNITSILDEFGADESKQTSGLLSTLDEGRPAQAVSNWVQCEKCDKWRRIPWHVDIDVLAKSFVCSDNKWNRASRSCDAPEDNYEDADNEIVAGAGTVQEDIGVGAEAFGPALTESTKDALPLKVDPPQPTVKAPKPTVGVSNPSSTAPSVIAEEQFVVGARFDVLRNGKSNYCVGVVLEVDMTIKKIKFHFPKLHSKHDELIEIGSPRIAPLYSKVTQPEKRMNSDSDVDKKRARVGEEGCSTFSDSKRNTDLPASNSVGWANSWAGSVDATDEVPRQPIPASAAASAAKLLAKFKKPPPVDSSPSINADQSGQQQNDSPGMKRLKKKKKKRKADDVTSASGFDNGPGLKDQERLLKSARLEPQLSQLPQPPNINNDVEGAVASLASLRIPKKIPKKQRSTDQTTAPLISNLIAEASSNQSGGLTSRPGSHKKSEKRSPYRNASNTSDRGAPIQKLAYTSASPSKSTSPQRSRSNHSSPPKQSPPQQDVPKSQVAQSVERANPDGSIEEPPSQPEIPKRVPKKPSPQLPRVRGYQDVQTSQPTQQQLLQQQLLQQAQQLQQLQQQPPLAQSFAAMDNAKQLERMQHIQTAINNELQRQAIQQVSNAIQAEIHRQQGVQLVSVFAAMASGSQGAQLPAAVPSEPPATHADTSSSPRSREYRHRDGERGRDRDSYHHYDYDDRSRYERYDRDRERDRRDYTYSSRDGDYSYSSRDYDRRDYRDYRHDRHSRRGGY